MQNKYNLNKVEGLEYGEDRTPSAKLALLFLQRSKERQSHFKIVQPNSRIWGSLYFPGFDMKSADFLLYINGHETSAKLIQVKK